MMHEQASLLCIIGRFGRHRFKLARHCILWYCSVVAASATTRCGSSDAVLVRKASGKRGERGVGEALDRMRFLDSRTLRRLQYGRMIGTVVTRSCCRRFAGSRHGLALIVEPRGKLVTVGVAFHLAEQMCYYVWPNVSWLPVANFPSHHEFAPLLLEQ